LGEKKSNFWEKEILPIPFRGPHVAEFPEAIADPREDPSTIFLAFDNNLPD
jgi:hypothetical protein